MKKPQWATKKLAMRPGTGRPSAVSSGSASAQKLTIILQHQYYFIVSEGADFEKMYWNVEFAMTTLRKRPSEQSWKQSWILDTF